MRYLPLLFIALTFFACSSMNDSIEPSGVSDTGVAGSYTRFITVADHLYIVDNEKIKTYSLENPQRPNLIDEQFIGEKVESIFHLNGIFFIGSGSGLYMYQLSEDGIPNKVAESLYNYPIMPCDPVVANETHAYVTLSSFNVQCGSFNQVNELQVYDINDINNPIWVNSQPMSNPKGVGIDDDLLFVCDDAEGVVIYDITNSPELEFLGKLGGITAFDVIPLDGLLIVIGPANIYQYDYSNRDNIIMLSSIDILQ